MHFYKDPGIAEFFDVSILLQINGNPEGFLRVLPLNQPFFQWNGIEVILLVQDIEKKLLDGIQEYPFINWKVIRCDKEVPSGQHDPAHLTQTGIREASHRYLLFLDPEAELFLDCMYLLRTSLKQYPGYIAIGKTVFAHPDAVITSANILSISHWTFGNIMVEKKALEETAASLESMAAKSLLVWDALSIRRTDDPAGSPGPGHLDILRKVFYPPMPAGLAGNGVSIAYDWGKDKSSRLRQAVLSQLEDFQLLDENAFQKEYEIICLMQVRNEIRHIPEVLLHLEQYCDGIILLDDGSTDGSYEAAASAKLLCKARRTHKGYFDDLENRNLLLKLGYLFQSHWFFFADADERLDARYADLRTISRMDQVDSVCFRVAHLWDSGENYRQDLPASAEGVYLFYRMFRNRGFMQIHSNRDLHFSATPFRRNRFDAEVLILHQGMMNKAGRMKKYQSYSLWDPGGKMQGFPYEFLIDENVRLGDVKNL